MKEKFEKNNKKFETGFGPHLVLDAYGCNKKKLEDMDLIFRILDKFPEEIGMKKITPPYVFKYIGSKPEDWGISGFVLIAESHISIHTFPEKKYMSLDIFSCKSFDAKDAIEYLKKVFGIEKYEYKIFDRGTEFPKNIQIVTEHIKKERHKIVPFVPDYKK